MASRTGTPRKRSARKTPAVSREKKKRAEPSPAARQQAHRIATRMPFVHFPSGRVFAEWKSWGALKSQTHRGLKPASNDPFDVLRASHVFAYAGPCCFAAATDNGDVAAYFSAALDQHSPGETSPFDSGALEGEPAGSAVPEGQRAHLQPWAQQTREERWKFFRRQVRQFQNWRQAFETWLLDCYNEAPGHYLDTAEDRYAAGTPSQTSPRAILQHNGTRGCALYGPGACADRRAWTWEARFEQPVPFTEVALLHVPNHRFQDVQEAILEESLGFGAASPPRVLPLPPDANASPDALYFHSRAAIEELLRP
jgi:hypothetical protein